MMSASFAASSTSHSDAPAMKSATTASTAIPHPSMKMPVCPVATKRVRGPRWIGAFRSSTCAVIFPTLQSDPTVCTTYASTSAASPSATGRLAGGLRASKMRTPRSRANAPSSGSSPMNVCRPLQISSPRSIAVRSQPRHSAGRRPPIGAIPISTAVAPRPRPCSKLPTSGSAPPNPSICCIRYMPERVVGVFDRAQAGKTVPEVLGFGGALPVVGNFEQGLGLGATAVLIGIAPMGGRLPAEWRGWLRTAIERGLEIWSGLHTFIGDDPELGALARERGVRIFDARRPPANLPVADGLAAEVDAYVVHTVGSDCNVGKMTAQVELRNALIARGHRTRFVATGQTGIFIEGWGIAVDAVVADFIAGASEWLVLEAAKDADIILVEGQGSLIHPGYSGVTLGLLHGCCPDALILCHQATRDYIGDYHGREPWVKIPPLPELVEIYERAAAPVRPTKVIGICLNTFDMSEAEARAAVARAAEATGLPATDPVRFGSAPLGDAIIQGAMAAK